MAAWGARGAGRGAGQAQRLCSMLMVLGLRVGLPHPPHGKGIGHRLMAFVY